MLDRVLSQLCNCYKLADTLVQMFTVLYTHYYQERVVGFELLTNLGNILGNTVLVMALYVSV